MGICGFLVSLCLCGCNAKQEDNIQRTDRTKRTQTEFEAGENTQAMELVD